jgi:hypothetical protein
MIDKIVKIQAPKIRLEEFINNLPELKNGRVELIGAFAHHMEYVRKITLATEEQFKGLLEEFRVMPV